MLCYVGFFCLLVVVRQLNVFLCSLGLLLVVPCAYELPDVSSLLPALRDFQLYVFLVLFPLDVAVFVCLMLVLFLLDVPFVVCLMFGLLLLGVPLFVFRIIGLLLLNVIVLVVVKFLLRFLQFFLTSPVTSFQIFVVLGMLLM